MKRLLFHLAIFTGSLAFGQTQKPDTMLVQFSGVIVSADSLKPLPFANILIRNTYRGTVSDYYGFFSFVAKKGDTIEFSSLGYRKGFFVIPDTITNQRYSLLQKLIPDTILLPEAVVYPWPSREQFKEAFISLKVPNDDMQRAEKNLARAEIKERYESMTMDGSMNFRNAMQQETSQLYYAGQLPPNNLLNPLAWAKFIQAWQNGDFKRK